MIMQSLKRVISYLPKDLQQFLKAQHYKRLIKSERFDAGESEYELLEKWVQKGDWVLDIGANIGQYTHKLSKLVGKQGRVIAFEPIPDTFKILSANMMHTPNRNITLFNVAVSDTTGIVSMEIPLHDTHLLNYYMAKITNEIKENHDAVMSISIDNLQINNKISLIKMDVEGHEKIALGGMINLIKRDHPTLIVEGDDVDVDRLLTELGYSYEKQKGSPNRVYRIKS